MHSVLVPSFWRRGCPVFEMEGSVSHIDRRTRCEVAPEGLSLLVVSKRTLILCLNRMANLSDRPFRIFRWAKTDASRRQSRTTRLSGRGRRGCAVEPKGPCGPCLRQVVGVFDMPDGQSPLSRAIQLVNIQSSRRVEGNLLRECPFPSRHLARVRR